MDDGVLGEDCVDSFQQRFVEFVGFRVFGYKARFVREILG